MKEYSISDILHYCHVKPKGCSKIGQHTIDYYDLTIVLEGSMVYIINKKRYILHSNDAIFLPPQTLREREQGDTVVDYVSFNFTLAEGIYYPFDTFLHKCLTVNIRRLLSLYKEAHMSDLPNSKAKCECLLNYILLELSDTVAANSRNTHVNKMLEYINTHETHKITLNDIGDYTHLSKEYCSYIFKREMNKTLVHYINEKKISIAKSLIANRDMPLIDICYYLGYDNYNYFSKLFKKLVGVSPSSFSGKW